MYEKKFMEEALKESIKAYSQGEVPVGAVIVYDGRIIARGHNKRQQTRDITSHAEINAIKKASSHLGSWNLDGCTLYVTLEPCLMCTGAILDSKIKLVYIGAVDKKNGAVVSKYNILQDTLDKKVVDYYFKDTVSPYILSRFFRNLRKK